MDLSAIKPVTVDVHIRHPGSGLDTGLVIQLASKQAEAVKKAQRHQLDKELARRGRKRSFEEVEASNLQFLAARVVGWEWTGDADWKGKKLEFTPENVSLVLSADWLRQQLEEEAANEADFFTS